MKIGAVSYLNALPLCRYLPYSIRYEKPAVLESLMQSKELDVALLPAFSFLRSSYHPIFEGGFIQSQGPVESVLLFYKESLSHPREIRSIRFTQASRTSVNLFKVLYSYCWEKDLKQLPEVQDDPDAVLEIGDQALFFDRRGYKVCDLGETWTSWTQLPFVYAFWVSQQKLPEEVIAKFRQAKEEGLRRMDDIVNEVKEWEPQALRHYLTKSLQYEMLPHSLDGLRLYQDYCFRLGLIPNKRSIP